MSIEDLLRDLARTLADVPEGTGEELREEFIRACRRVDDDPREQQRIDDIADLLEAEETLYAQARAAADRSDADTAVPLLRQCAEAGTGEAAWLLAQLLEKTGDISEATIWYQRARDDGDARADEKLAALRTWPCPFASIAGNPQEDHAATAARNAPVIFVSHEQNSPLISVADLAGPAPGLRTSLLRLLMTVLMPQVPDPGNATSVWPFIFSDPGSDHLASVADMWYAVETRNWFVRDTSWAETRLVKKLAKIEARESARARERTLRSWLMLCSDCRAAETQAAAAQALRSRWIWEDYDRPCPANLGRYLAFRRDTRPPAGEPIVANMMLPPSEVPECRPDTTLIEALERLVQSGAQALPVCERSRVAGIVTLADLARHINDHLGVPSATETVKVLMRPATSVPAETPLSAIAQAIADDGIIVVSGPGDRPVGYLTAESVLTQAPRASDHPNAQDRPPLLIPGTGAVLLNRGQLPAAPDRARPGRPDRPSRTSDLSPLRRARLARPPAKRRVY
jgi:CBS domain-containing protein